MSEYEVEPAEPPRSQGKPRSFLRGILLLGAGVIVGLVVAREIQPPHVTPTVTELTTPKPASATRPLPARIASPAERGEDFVQVAKTAMPAVVNIVSTRRAEQGLGSHGFLEDPSLRRFFGDELLRRFGEPGGRPGTRERGLGSGVIVDPSGIIITNNHVVQQAEEIKVLLADKTQLRAELIGTDPKTDLAVLKVDATRLPIIPWADSDRLEVGEYVLAVGNPFGLHQTVTMGIVSAVGRARVGIAEYEDFIQTDAAINPGNSGGALVNARGELVGINTAIFSRNGGNMGIGFAVPSNMARTILGQLVSNGKVIRGWLGVSIQNLSQDLAVQFGVSEPKGVLINDVIEGSPAERAGLQRGDVIVRFNGKAVDDATQLKNVVAAARVGSKAPITVIRDERARTLQIRVGEQPQSLAKA